MICIGCRFPSGLALTCHIKNTPDGSMFIAFVFHSNLDFTFFHSFVWEDRCIISLNLQLACQYFFPYSVESKVTKC